MSLFYRLVGPLMWSKRRPKELAVLLVDMQEHFTMNLRPGERARIAANQIAALEECRRKGTLVIVISYGGCGKTTPELRPELRRLRHVIRFTKWTQGAFSSPKLAGILRRFGITKVFLMGINADACVLDTADGALAYGFAIATSNDVISGKVGDSEDNSADWYRKNGTFAETYSFS